MFSHSHTNSSTAAFDYNHHCVWCALPFAKTHCARSICEQTTPRGPVKRGCPSVAYDAQIEQSQDLNKMERSSCDSKLPRPATHKEDLHTNNATNMIRMIDFSQPACPCHQLVSAKSPLKIGQLRWACSTFTSNVSRALRAPKIEHPCETPYPRENVNKRFQTFTFQTISTLTASRVITRNNSSLPPCALFFHPDSRRTHKSLDSRARHYFFPRARTNSRGWSGP